MSLVATETCSHQSPGESERRHLTERQVREAAQALLKRGQADEALELSFSALAAVLDKNRDLELLVAKLRRERIGKSSERVNPDQLRLLFEKMCAMGQSELQIDPKAEDRDDAVLSREIEAAEQQSSQTVRRKKRRRGVKARDSVERQIHEHKVPNEERKCEKCGRPKTSLGVDVSTSLEYQPGHFIVHEHRREKCVCSTCKDGVTTAKGPIKPIEKSPVTPSLLAHVVVSKHVDHTPLHRLSRMYARCGVEIPVSTLADWDAYVANTVTPLVDLLADRVLKAHVLGIDGTGLKVLDRNSPDNIERGTIWTCVGDERDVLFRYRPTGQGAGGPWEFLAKRTGYVQADAANVFDRLYNGRAARAIEIGCWYHGRRGLTALQDMDCRVAYPLRLIARLYRIEHLADARQLSPDERVLLRQQRSQVVLDKLKRWLIITSGSEPPGSDMAKAIGYLFNQWESLTCFLTDGRIKLDNNVVEQQHRDIALGRRNFLFAGSHDAARRMATIYSLTRTCAQYKVPPLPYFTDILQKFANGWPQERYAELLPDQWQTLHAP